VGWDQPLSVDHDEVVLNNNGRYDNAYSQTEFNSDEVKIATGEHQLNLNWKTRERRTE
jgi:hypothetical protein